MCCSRKLVLYEVVLDLSKLRRRGIITRLVKRRICPTILSRELDRSFKNSPFNLSGVTAVSNKISNSDGNDFITKRNLGECCLALVTKYQRPVSKFLFGQWRCRLASQTYWCPKEWGQSCGPEVYNTIVSDFKYDSANLVTCRIIAQLVGNPSWIFSCPTIMIELGPASEFVSPMPGIGNSSPSTFSVHPVKTPKLLDCVRANDGIALSPRKGGRTHVGETGNISTLSLLPPMLDGAGTSDLKGGVAMLLGLWGRRWEVEGVLGPMLGTRSYEHKSGCFLSLHVSHGCPLSQFTFRSRHGKHEVTRRCFLCLNRSILAPRDAPRGTGRVSVIAVSSCVLLLSISTTVLPDSASRRWIKSGVDFVYNT